MAGLVTATVLLGTTGMALTCAGAGAALFRLSERSPAVENMEVASLERPDATPARPYVPDPEPEPVVAAPQPEVVVAAPEPVVTEPEPVVTEPEPVVAEAEPAPPRSTARTTSRRNTPTQTGVVTMYRRRPADGSTTPSRSTTLSRSSRTSRTTTSSRSASTSRSTVASGSSGTDASYADLLSDEEEDFVYLDGGPDAEDAESAGEPTDNDEMAAELDEILEDFDPGAY